MLQGVQRSFAERVVLDERICADLFAAHRFPQRLVRNHKKHLLVISIIFCRFGVEYSRDAGYNSYEVMIMFQDTYTEKPMYERAIGAAVLEYMRNYEPERLLLELNSEAIKILQDIQAILDDETLDDPECFHKIEAIVSAFYAHGVDTFRHDFG